MSLLPFVSIITPSFNRADLVGETLDSVKAQTFDDWEHIVVDDGSTDRTREVMRSYTGEDPRIRFYERDRAPKGACTCRNIGLEMARGKYVVFLDSDDLLAPYCLEQRVGYMEQNEKVDTAYFPVLRFKKELDDQLVLWNRDSEESELSRLIKADPSGCTPSTIWSRAYLQKLGGFDESLSAWQDTDLYFRAIIGGCNWARRFDLPPDVFIRDHESGVSKDNYFTKEKMSSRARVVKKAVSLLHENDKKDRAPEMRYMFAQVARGAAKGLNSDIAFDLCSWGRDKNVLTANEAWIIQLFTVAHLLRLVKLSPVRQWCDNSYKRFALPRNVGKIPIRETDVPMPPRFPSVVEGQE